MNWIELSLRLQLYGSVLYGRRFGTCSNYSASSSAYTSYYTGSYSGSYSGSYIGSDNRIDNSSNGRSFQKRWALVQLNRSIQMCLTLKLNWWFHVQVVVSWRSRPPGLLEVNRPIKENGRGWRRCCATPAISTAAECSSLISTSSPLPTASISNSVLFRVGLLTTDWTDFIFIWPFSFKASDITIRLGEYDFGSQSNSRRDFDVEKVYMHERYDRKTYSTIQLS